MVYCIWNHAALYKTNRVVGVVLMLHTQWRTSVTQWLDCRFCAQKHCMGDFCVTYKGGGVFVIRVCDG